MEGGACKSISRLLLDLFLPDEWGASATNNAGEDDTENLQAIPASNINSGGLRCETLRMLRLEEEVRGEVSLMSVVACTCERIPCSASIEFFLQLR